MHRPHSFPYVGIAIVLFACTSVRAQPPGEVLLVPPQLGLARVDGEVLELSHGVKRQVQVTDHTIVIAGADGENRHPTVTRELIETQTIRLSLRGVAVRQVDGTTVTAATVSETLRTQRPVVVEWPGERIDPALTILLKPDAIVISVLGPRKIAPVPLPSSSRPRKRHYGFRLLNGCQAFLRRWKSMP